MTDLEGLLQFSGLDWLMLAISVGITLVLCLRYWKTGSRPLLNYIPSVWTSCGILGTFVALCLSLNGVRFTGEVEDIKLLIDNVLPAFRTSIMGIVGSIIASLFLRLKFAASDVTEDKKLMSVLCGIESHLANLHGGVNEMASDFARTVIKTAGKEMQLAIMSHMRAMERSITQESKIIESMSDEITSAVRSISDVHKEELTKITEQYRKDASSVAVKCAEALEKHREEFVKITRDSLESQSDRMAKQTEEMMGTLSDGLKESVNAMIGSFADLSTEFNKFNASIADLQNKISSLEKLIGKTLPESQSRIDSLTDSMKELSSAETISMSMIQGYVEKIANVSSQMSLSAMEMEKIFKRFDVEQYVDAKLLDLYQKDSGTKEPSRSGKSIKSIVAKVKRYFDEM